MSKTPYELRFEVLTMAQAIIIENLINERIRLENDWNVERDRAHLRMSNGETHITVPAFPEIPKIDTNDVIALARKLNEFVSDNGEHKNA